MAGLLTEIDCSSFGTSETLRKAAFGSVMPVSLEQLDSHVIKFDI